MENPGTKTDSHGLNVLVRGGTPNRRTTTDSDGHKARAGKTRACWRLRRITRVAPAHATLRSRSAPNSARGDACAVQRGQYRFVGPRLSLLASGVASGFGLSSHDRCTNFAFEGVACDSVSEHGSSDGLDPADVGQRTREGVPPRQLLADSVDRVEGDSLPPMVRGMVHVVAVIPSHRGRVQTTGWPQQANEAVEVAQLLVGGQQVTRDIRVEDYVIRGIWEVTKVQFSAFHVQSRSEAGALFQSLGQHAASHGRHVDGVDDAAFGGEVQ